ncbi:hypothetical protein O3W47_02645 [Agrobacterium sp. LMR679]|nr:hypothetical protein [Agrobacterium sp. LMR679]MCZ4072024.1 hypothetical protein [Agrobacterium sp. LMR679]
MQTVKRLTIAIIGMTDTVTSEIRMAWFHAQIGLEGPYSASFIESEDALKFAAAIIDVRYEADVMLRLTEQLDEEAIPYLFSCRRRLLTASRDLLSSPDVRKTSKTLFPL